MYACLQVLCLWEIHSKIYARKKISHYAIVANGSVTPAMFSSRTSGIWYIHNLRSNLRVPNLKIFYGGACP